MIDRGQWAQVCWSNIAYAEHTWRKKLAVALKLEIYWLPSITKLQLSETEGSDTCTRYIWFNELPTTALPRQSGNTKLSFISDLVRTKQWGGGYKKKSQEWDRFSLLSLSLSLSLFLSLPSCFRKQDIDNNFLCYGTSKNEPIFSLLSCAFCGGGLVVVVVFGYVFCSLLSLFVCLEQHLCFKLGWL